MTRIDESSDGRRVTVSVRGLVKHYGETKALDGVDLDVREGTVMGVLGPNGAGKTTLVRILSTLITPDTGAAMVAGYDVVRQPRQLRRVIGLTGQYASVDEKLPGWENLYMIGRLLDLSRKDARARADELLERFSLTDAAKRPASTYSGGMRRRLDLAASMIGRPQVLFLDEPTTGLDPRTRNEVWDEVKAMVGEGVTVLLTTQYMEEAEQLASELTVVDRGKVVAAGRIEELKARVGGRTLRIRPVDPLQLGPLAAMLDELGITGLATTTVDRENNTLLVPILSDEQLTAVVGAVTARGITISSIVTELPSLDEVFLSLTGHRASAPQDATPAESDSDSDAREEVAV
ncbi:ATP-binding cassette domain-containing protein [Streptomyces sp. NPDC004549]|uniref:ATP-binding cassette domain-containing protein n=1 Tax=Streptomyces sp. NPDC004549 TaxID=3154283 RepID=UPI0033A3AF54